MKDLWARLPHWGRRGVKALGFGLAGLVAILGVVVAVTEANCRATPVAAGAAYRAIVDAADRRDEINSYLAYPEWSIVHAYEDLAGVMRAGSESDFGYWRSIRGFWSSLCSVKLKAATHGPISLDFNSALYTIGVSFTVEMGIKGLYESTIGRATAWLRGSTPTPEDRFALAFAEDYAVFLRQVPFYEYPFGTKLWRFWADTPLWGGNVVRKLERRIALTLEYGSKAIYARFIRVLAGLTPAPLRIRSVVRDRPPGDQAVDPRIEVVRDLGQGVSIIETPRYREFTAIIRGLAERGGNFVEIAGNANILVTVIQPAGDTVDPALARGLFTVPLQARPGFVRVGYELRVDQLTAFIRSLSGTALELEHVYDY